MSPVGSVAHAILAVDAAASVRADLAGLSTGIRRTLLVGIHDALFERTAQFEQLLVLETGKPLVDCRTEVARALTTWSASAEEVAHQHGETVPLDLQ
ncbi:acyl-CoA reductase-like NAD-dependent aldehyde dehydrogenase [Cryobacterium sp. CAN_C3]|nr:acyl-CoA reductase-like NAD-dependent aldehyde dehydrogenase [Cryobacterium sp. CAN_C3]